MEGLLVSKYISWKEPDHNIKLQYKYQIDVGELFLLQKNKKENKCYVSKPNSIWSIAQCENWRIFLQCEFSIIKKKLWNCPNGTISRFFNQSYIFYVKWSVRKIVRFPLFGVQIPSWKSECGNCKNNLPLCTTLFWEKVPWNRTTLLICYVWRFHEIFAISKNNFWFSTLWMLEFL